MLLRYCLSDFEMVPVTSPVSLLLSHSTCAEFLLWGFYILKSSQIPNKQLAISFTALGTMDLERKAYMLVLYCISLINFSAQQSTFLPARFRHALCGDHVQCMCGPCHVQTMSCPVHVMSSPCHVQTMSWPVHVMSSPCHVQSMSCPDHVMSRPCHVQSMSCPVHVMSSPCHVQSMSCPDHVMSSPCHVQSICFCVT